MVAPPDQETLPMMASRRAFEGLSKSWMIEFAKLVDCEVSSGDHVWDVLWTLVHKYQQCSDDAMLEIMRHACYPDSQRSHERVLQECELVRDTMTKDERKTFDDAAKLSRVGSDERKELLKKFKIKRKEIRERRNAGKGRGGKGKRGRGGKRPFDPLGRHKVLALVPEDAITQGQLKQLWQQLN